MLSFQLSFQLSFGVCPQVGSVSISSLALMAPAVIDTVTQGATAQGKKTTNIKKLSKLNLHRHVDLVSD